MVRADDWFEQTFTRLKERDSLHDLEYEMRRKDGTTFSVLVNVVAIKDTDGRFVRSHAISLAFESADAMPLAAPLAGQFVVLRMRPPQATSPLMRSYSLSAAPNAECHESKCAPAITISSRSCGSVPGISATTL